MNQKKKEDKIDLTPHKNESAPNTSVNYTMGEMPFNSLKTEFLEGKTLQRQHIKTQAENPRMPESGFTLDKTMHLNINFHKLALIPGGSYTELPKWIKAVINPQKKDELCFQ